MTGASTRVWLLLGIVSFGDFVWCASLGMGPRLGATAEWILLWLIFSVAGAVMTYLAAAQDGAVYDARLALLDAELGFRWSGWLAHVENNTRIQFSFHGAY